MFIFVLPERAGHLPGLISGQNKGFVPMIWEGNGENVLLVKRTTEKFIWVSGKDWEVGEGVGVEQRISEQPGSRHSLLLLGTCLLYWKSRYSAPTMWQAGRWK